MRKGTRIIGLLGAGIMAASVFGLCACGKVGNDEQTLQMFVGDFGYGKAWLDAIIENFKQEDWVKEKYPELNIPRPQSNSERMYPVDQITSGKTSIDLFFAGTCQPYYYSMTGADGNSYFEELSDLYETKVFGENVTFGEKMNDEFYKSYKVKANGKEGYYSAPWAQGPWGLFYNQAAVTEKLGADYKMPVTTNGLLQMCGALKAGANPKVPFVFCAAEDYQKFIVETWWAQYEGAENYERFWYGVDENDMLSPDEFVPMKQKGKLRALEALEALIGKDSGNTHQYVNDMSFTMAQTHLLEGEGVMQVNGDWILNEMSGIADEEMLSRISMMKTPVVSGIVERLSFYGTEKDYSELTDAEKSALDAKLQAIIAEVDAGAAKSEIEGVSANDFAIVKEARNMVNIINGHDALIPSYATAKGLAKDFLLYMATDKSLNTYAGVTGGCQLAYEYDIEEKDPELYAGLLGMHKEKIDMMKNGVVKPFESMYELQYAGMVQAFPSYDNVSFCFTATFKGDYHTAREIYEADIDYYAKNQAYNWKQVLSRLGY